MDYLINPLICVAFCAQAAMNILPGCRFTCGSCSSRRFHLGESARHSDVGTHERSALRRHDDRRAAVPAAVVRAVMHMQRGAGFFTHPFYDPATFHVPSVLSATSVSVLTTSDLTPCRRS